MTSIFITLIAYIAAYLAGQESWYALSGLILILTAVLLYGIFYKRSGRPLCPAALFSLAWVGGCGVSALKLSRLEVPWEKKTWICFFLIEAGFLLGAQWRKKQNGRRIQEAVPEICYDAELQQQTAQAQADESCRTKKARLAAIMTETPVSALERRLFSCILLLTVISYAAFFLEAFLLGYIPLFTTDTPHAYSYFHISGVHYFTVSCVLVPSLFVLFVSAVLEHEKKQQRRKLSFKKLLRTCLIPLCCTLLSLALPLLLVSRFQLLFAVLLATFTWLLRTGKRIGDLLKGKALCICGLCVLLLFGLYVFLTVERAHSVSYLNGIFEMKDPGMPIFITQPYIYIANNFDNFNCLVRELPAHTHGLRMLFPLFALTGLKFFCPALVSFPIYVTKEELTTVTLFYDAYYDFGVPGIFLFAILLGAVTSGFFRLLGALSRAEREKPPGSARKMNPMLYLIGAQLCFYCLFAFFTTWYSNPATWFYLGLSFLLLLFLGLPHSGRATFRRRKNFL